MDKELVALADHLGASLAASGRRIAIAESCTGGWIAQTLTSVAGSSTWFDCAFITYSNHSKTNLLQVEPGTLAMYGAVSSEVILEMLSGALNTSCSDVAMAVSGIAGPTGGTEDKPVGTVYIGWLVKHQKAVIERLFFTGNREQIRRQTVQYALEQAIRLF